MQKVHRFQLCGCKNIVYRPSEKYSQHPGKRTAGLANSHTAEGKTSQSSTSPETEPLGEAGHTINT